MGSCRLHNKPPKNEKSTNIKSLKLKGNTVTDPNKMADIMNKFFSTIGKNLASQIKTKDNGFRKYLKNRVQQSIQLDEVTSEEVFKILKQLKSKKAAGDDGIRPELLKKCAQHLKGPITHIMKLSLKKGIVPESLKTAKVMPIYKKK